MTALDDALLDAHVRDDRAALVGLYERAANEATNADAACFYLTHAYVFALETGDPRAGGLYKCLKDKGREG